jgi:hypothetical protein
MLGIAAPVGGHDGFPATDLIAQIDRAFWAAIVSANLSAGCRRWQVMDGNRDYLRFAFAWPDRRIAVEVHGNYEISRGDAYDKLNNAAANGWVVYHIGPERERWQVALTALALKLHPLQGGASCDG